MTAETAITVLGYRSSMKNCELGFKKSEDGIETLWVLVGVVSNPENVQVT